MTAALTTLLERVVHDGGHMPALLAGLIIRPEYRGDERPEIGTRIACARAERFDWSHDGGPDDIVAFVAIGIATADTEGR